MRLLLLLGLLGLSAAAPERAHQFARGLNRIVGGDRATLDQFPWQVSIREFADSGALHVCGGSVIAEKWVVTAAHCCNALPILYHIVAGGIDNFRNETTSEGVSIEQHVDVVSQHRHPDYNSATFANDICLLELRDELVFDVHVMPATLPDPSFRLEENTTLTVTGYGTLSEGGLPAEWLQWVDVLVVADGKCDEAYSAAGAPPIIESMLCAGDMADGGEDACQGDSGGPYVVKDTDVLVGVVSWGFGCARPGFPGVNTEVAYFIDWINQVMGGGAVGNVKV